ncbi:methyl-accepting chemotaxis protein [Kordiimonas aestuarii]|uniref:methyl-accepting chemotaxis protein n=1 Tax=Kordiimonas aestuarii TaxID=1005925 RepID=UPI0021CDF9ED|nr:methyl-accepting chemotaxis protein [Kordiimonas aestuarii]
MAALDNILQNKVFSIRNLLLFVTATLMVIVISLTWARMDTALENSARAERSMEVNALIDDIVQLKLALSDERGATYTSYGSPQPASSDFEKIISNSRQDVDDAYGNIVEKLEKIEPFDGQDVNEKIYEGVTARFEETKQKFRDAFGKYESQLSTIDEDLGKMEGARDLNGRSATNVMTDLVEAAAKVRIALEENYDFGDDRISQVIRLKHQLWLMLEYATRESASLGENVASGEQISSIKRDQGSRYGGYGQAAWSQVMGIANSVSFAREDTTPESRDAQIEAIQKAFFNDFELTRFDLYDLSDEAEPNEEMQTIVDYGVTPIEWVRLAENAAKPVMNMNAYAKELSASLNDEAVGTAAANVTLAIVLMVFVIAIGGVAVWVVMFKVVRPVNALSDTMMVLSKGNLDVEVPYTEGGDEVSDMARSVQIFKENAIERQELEAKQREREEQERERAEEEERTKREEAETQRQREQEREEKARHERRQAMLDLADKFEASVMAVVQGVSNSATEMENAARGMAETADDTSKKSEVVANAAQQASSNAQMVASAAEELSASVREITGQTNQSSASARDAVNRTENAGKDVAELVDAAQKIGDVVKLINDIAEQTNLLALNATIEAARAGDAGKGFAVVASEVKSLANQTAKATQEISEQVEGMQQATNLAVRAMDEIKGIIGAIESTSVSIASAVEEQDASTQEIARNVSEVSTGTEEVTSNIHAVNQGATSTGAAATEVLTAAQLLTQQSDELRGQVEAFLRTIREEE